MDAVVLRHITNTNEPVKLNSGEITLGRKSDNTVQIPHDTVSGHHARIFTYFCVSYVEDLNSKNGTFVNGKRIKQHILKPGDSLKLGKYEFQVELPKTQLSPTIPMANEG